MLVGEQSGELLHEAGPVLPNDHNTTCKSCLDQNRETGI